MKILHVGPGDDELDAYVEFIDGDGKRACASIKSHTWQITRIYYEVIANTFIRAPKFAATEFPISCGELETDSKSRASAHFEFDNVHLILRGAGNSRLRHFRLRVDAFVQDRPTGRFEHGEFYCTFEDAARFGQEILDEIGPETEDIDGDLTEDE